MSDESLIIARYYMTERSFLNEMISFLGEYVLLLTLCRVGGKVKSKTSDTRGGVSTALTPASVSKSRSESQGEFQTSSDGRITNEPSNHRC